MIRAVWVHLRYGTWFATRGHRYWYAQRYWLLAPLEFEGPMTKREAEGVAAMNNDSRGL